MVLELAPDVLAGIAAEAARVDKTPEELVAELLRWRFVRPAAEGPPPPGVPTRSDGTAIPP